MKINLTKEGNIELTPENNTEIYYIKCFIEDYTKGNTYIFINRDIEENDTIKIGQDTGVE